MNQRPTRFHSRAYEQQSRFRAALSATVPGRSDEHYLRHGHLLALDRELENLYEGIRPPGGAVEFFAKRGIQWWRSSNCGDRGRGDGYTGPTRNLASSQVGCVNFLLPLATVPGALLAFLRTVDADVEAIEPIVDSAGNSSLVEFEWVGWEKSLEDGPLTRGATQTSVDALLLARTKAGLRAYLVEWKYTEAYRSPGNKGTGPGGATRAQRYKALYTCSDSSFNGTAPFEEFLFEPFYQLMRLRLLADKMRRKGVTSELRVEEARLIVVCPAENDAFREVVSTIPLGRRFSAHTSVEAVIRQTLKNPTQFTMISQQSLVEHFRQSALAGGLHDWLDYHNRRYGW